MDTWAHVHLGVVWALGCRSTCALGWTWTMRRCEWGRARLVHSALTCTCRVLGVSSTILIGPVDGTMCNSAREGVRCRGSHPGPAVQCIRMCTWRCPPCSSATITHGIRALPIPPPPRLPPCCRVYHTFRLYPKPCVPVTVAGLEVCRWVALAGLGGSRGPARRQSDSVHTARGQGQRVGL